MNFIPTSNAGGFPFLHTFSRTVCRFFDDGHSDKCEVMPHCSFDLHSLIMSKIKTAEHQIIDAFELGCWRRLLRVPWTARRSNQSILKEISPEYSLVRTDAETEAPILWPPDVKK